MAEALGISLDPSFIAYISIGGRHAQYLWRLLNGLKIPHITLLDFDLGRYGGGTGRIKNALTWLTELSSVYMPQVPVQLPTTAPTDRPATATDVVDNTALSAGTLDDWVKCLRPQNIFYSSPLDLDMMMMTAFPAAYVTDSAFDPAADKVKLAASVFGDGGKGNAVLNPVGINYTDKEIFKYKALFKSSSKPGSHFRAFAKLTIEQLKAGCPEPLKALVNRANELIASRKGAV